MWLHAANHRGVQPHLGDGLALVVGEHHARVLHKLPAHLASLREQPRVEHRVRVAAHVVDRLQLH
eukprot:1352837-Prymnesium_polylepis.1